MWCAEGNLRMTKRKKARANTLTAHTKPHTCMHVSRPPSHSHTHTRLPTIPHSYQCSGGSARPWSYRQELNLSGCLPFCPRACTSAFFTAARPAPRVFDSSVCTYKIRLATSLRTCCAVSPVLHAHSFSATLTQKPGRASEREGEREQGKLE